MIISRMRANHLEDPIGYSFDPLSLSYVVEETDAKRQLAARIVIAEDEALTEPVYDSGRSEHIVSTGFDVPFTPRPETRYYWRVTVWADDGDCADSPIAWFETAKAGEWQAQWITPDADKQLQVCVERRFDITRPVRSARLYGVGLGLYELYLNGTKQGDEVLMPGFCAYDTYIPYQTYPLELRQGENSVSFMLGDGWYKGWFGLQKKSENYGDRLACLAELHILYEDGTRETIVTDERWTARRSPVTYSGIYPGEVYEPGVSDEERFAVRICETPIAPPEPRLDPPIRVIEHVRPIEVITTPKGETVLDMGQNMVGWLAFRCAAPKGTTLRLQFGEILQDGCFYNDNLRTAKAEFTYVSDGVAREVRQHFTFYGFRYVKLTGFAGEISLDDFSGLVIHSVMDRIGELETSDPLVNKLIQNAWWGQRGNFLDIPTDCPQRDERYGWTGDAEIFSGTACFSADTFAFYAKYGRDLWAEQQRLGGKVPDTVPIANNGVNTSTVWGDAATVIPWNVYLHSGDTQILVRQYESMHTWVDYIRSEDIKYGDRRLWQTGFHYGDWLALDGNVPGGVYGATDPYLIASAFYYLSCDIVARSAALIGREADAHYYSVLAGDIRSAFLAEYYTPSGRLAVDTMTAYVVVLYTGLVPEGATERVRRGLLQRLQRRDFHLETGFVGTPFLCRVLSENGMNDIAYHLLMEKGYPGWLYEVLMGATTVWERWNSVLPDGHISGTDMNSLNHYSYGAIVEWMYRCMVGICPKAQGAGFKRFTLAPKPDPALGFARGRLASASGRIESEWRIEGTRLSLRFTVPFDTEAELVLPGVRPEALTLPEGARDVHAENGCTVLTVGAGRYRFEYEAPTVCRRVYSIDSAVADLLAYEPTRRIVEREYYTLAPHRPFDEQLFTLREQMNGPFTNVSYEDQQRIDALLRQA